MKNIFRFLVYVFVGLMPLITHADDLAPDALVKKISQEVITIVKQDKDIQAGDIQKTNQLVEAKILPYVDFQKMTSSTIGRFWAKATAEQQERLTSEFRSLLVYTYSGALSEIKDQTIQFRPLRQNPEDTQVVVRSQVIQPQGSPIQLNYRLEKSAQGWKMIDINIAGVWLVETYRSSFAAEISKNGIDGLIKSLSDKNKSLAQRASAQVRNKT